MITKVLGPLFSQSVDQKMESREQYARINRRKCTPRGGAVYGTFSADSHLNRLSKNLNWLTIALAVSAREGEAQQGRRATLVASEPGGCGTRRGPAPHPLPTSMDSDSADNKHSRAILVDDSLYPPMQQRKRELATRKCGRAPNTS